MADDKNIPILLSLYDNLLTTFKQTTEFWTQKSSIPDKVPQLSDVGGEDSEDDNNVELHETFRNHRKYLEELLENYRKALRKQFECEDVMNRLWKLKRKYKLPAKEDVDAGGAEKQKNAYWRHIKALEVIDQRLSDKMHTTSDETISNASSEKNKDLKIPKERTRNQQLEENTFSKGNTQNPIAEDQAMSERDPSQEEVLKNLRSELDVLTSKYEESRQANKELTEKLIHHQVKEQEYKEEIERYDELMKRPENKKVITIQQLKVELKAKTKDLEEQTKIYNKVKKDLEKKEREIENFKVDLTKRRPKTAPPGHNVKVMEKTIQDLRRENTMYIQNNKSLKSEKDSLMERLSKIAGSKMKDNNPAIADLSDPNRPERLAEQYKEIYDNAWTDVLDKLDDLTGDGESNNVKTILNVLEVIYTACKDEIDSRKKTLMESVGYDENVLQKQTCPGEKDVYDSNIKTCKDLIKSSAMRMKDPIFEVIKRKTEIAKVIELCGASAIKFVANCTDVCIHMSVQDPPVVLNFNYNSDDTFDKDCLNAFTKGGDVIDYMVWPPMYLHTDGPLLSKGVAQGKLSKCGAIESKKSDQQQTSDDPKEATAQTAVEKLTKSKSDKRDQQNDQEPESSNDKRNERQGEKPADIHRTNNEQPSEQDVVVTLKDKSDKNREKGNSNGNNDQYSKRKDMAKEKTEQDSNQRHGEHKTEKNTNQQKEQHKPEAIQQTNQKEESAKKRGKGPKESNIEEPIEDEKSGKGKDNNCSVDDDDSVMKSGDTTKTSDKHQYKKKKKKKNEND